MTQAAVRAAVAAAATVAHPGRGAGRVRVRRSRDPDACGGDRRPGKLTIGISFDQPGLGLKDGDTTAGSTSTRRSTSPRRSASAAGNITWVEANPATGRRC